MDSIQNNRQDNIIPSRIEALRASMSREGISAYMIPTSDFHNSEYVSDYFKCREYMSGFTGSNGTLVITDTDAGLWTDGRYFIQAEMELKGTGIELYRMGEPGVPKIIEYLKSNLSKGDVLGFDGRTIPAIQGKKYQEELDQYGITIKCDCDLVGDIWDSRPAMPNNPIIALNESISGESALSKIEKCREEIKKHNADSWLCTKLDDIMWLLNIRGRDVECNPVALSYLYMTLSELHFFVQENELTSGTIDYLLNIGVTIHDYADVSSYLIQNMSDKPMLDLANTNYTFYKLASNRGKVINATNPTDLYKAIKNEVELNNIREAYLQDSVALTRFICWLKNSVGTEYMDEISVAEVLDSYRAKLPGFIDLSFPTISAYADNAAIVHYEATDKTNREIKAKGMYLVDSGGQYMNGTTDVTRTIVLGDITDEMREHFTYVAIGMLRLADAKFLDGCTGRNLDIIARSELWNHGLDYKHGTGHGIGYILNVHEGPQNIRWRYLEGTSEAVLKPGMIVSDEPGLYIAGSHGIRTENILEVREWLNNSDGCFYSFEHLTYVPIDLDGIDVSLLDKKDITLINEYHCKVREKLMGYMQTDVEKEWLLTSTRAIL